MPLVPLLWLPIAPRGAEVVLLVWAHSSMLVVGMGGGGLLLLAGIIALLP